MVTNEMRVEDYAPSKKLDEGSYVVRALPKYNEDNTIVTCVEDVIDHEPTEEDFAALEAEYVAKKKRHLLQAAADYDVSESVNGFIVNGKRIWLDKATRVGLVNSLNVEKTAGVETTVLWFDDVNYTLPVDTALQILAQVELYAIRCYNKTAEHRVKIAALATPEEADAFDITAGYPEQPSFTIE